MVAFERSLYISSVVFAVNILMILSAFSKGSSSHLVDKLYLLKLTLHSRTKKYMPPLIIPYTHNPHLIDDYQGETPGRH